MSNFGEALVGQRIHYRARGPGFDREGYAVVVESDLELASLRFPWVLASLSVPLQAVERSLADRYGLHVVTREHLGDGGGYFRVQWGRPAKPTGRHVDGTGTLDVVIPD